MPTGSQVTYFHAYTTAFPFQLDIGERRRRMEPGCLTGAASQHAGRAPNKATSHPITNVPPRLADPARSVVAKTHHP